MAVDKNTAFRTHSSTIHKEYPGKKVDIVRGAAAGLWYVKVDGVLRGYIDADNRLWLEEEKR